MKTKKIFAIVLMAVMLLGMSLVPISSVSADDVQEQILESYLKKDSVLTFEKDDSGIYLCGMPEKLTVSDLLTNIKKGAVLKNAAGEEKTGSDIVVTGEDGFFNYFRNPRTMLAEAKRSWRAAPKPRASRNAPAPQRTGSYHPPAAGSPRAARS